MIFRRTVPLFCSHRSKAMHCTPTMTAPPVYTLAPHTHIYVYTSIVGPTPLCAVVTNTDERRAWQHFVRGQNKEDVGRWLVKGAFSYSSYLPVLMHSHKSHLIIYCYKIFLLVIFFFTLINNDQLRFFLYHGHSSET